MLVKLIVCSFTIFAILGYALHLEAYVPKLPIYIGEGYNIYEGNPMTNMIDPGFTMPIFDFSFDKGEKTEDGRFRLPDYTLSRQLSSCSYDAKVKSYKGAR